MGYNLQYIHHTYLQHSREILLDQNFGHHVRDFIQILMNILTTYLVEGR